LSFTGISFILSIIDAVAFYTMSNDKFDRRYNPELFKEQYDASGEKSAATTRRTRSTPPQPHLVKTKRNKKKASVYKKEGLAYFQEYDYKGAIEAFEKALEYNPKDPAIHYNMACCYSLLELKEKAFRHLDLATKFGFKDDERLRTKDQLAYLRIQPEWQLFEKNGFQIPNEGFSVKGKESKNLLEELDRLRFLRENDLLSEKEYQLLIEKARNK